MMKRLLAFTMISVGLWGCTDFRLQLAEGRRLESIGRFDAALERYQRAAAYRPNDPRLMASLGRALTLRRISLMVGTGMMARSLKKVSDQGVRQDLLLLYLDMRLTEEARLLVGPKSIPVKEYFRPRMQVLRAGTACVIRPATPVYNNLKGLPASALQDYFLARCLYRWGYKKDALKQWAGIKDRRLQCRLAVAWEDVDFPGKPGTTSQSPSEKLGPQPMSGPKGKPGETGQKQPASLRPPIVAKCRKELPGEIALFRETPPDLSKTDPQQVRLMFRSKVELPPYERPPWSKIKELKGE